MINCNKNSSTACACELIFHARSWFKTRNVIVCIGLFSLFGILFGTAAIAINPDLRRQLFFSQAVQSIFANEMDLVSTGLFNRDIEMALALPVPQSQLNRSGIQPASFQKQDLKKTLTAGQQRVAVYLSKRYRVSCEAVESLVRLAYKVGKEEKVEPTLILAIVGVESSYNPFAASAVGASGLMQVMSKVHKDKFEALSPGDWSALNPEMNMRVGAKIIREYTRRSGNVQDGLRGYVGAAVHGNDGGYAVKVLALKARIDSEHKQGLLLATRQKTDNVSVIANNVAKSG